ncbi:hypothetical protein GCM10012320_30010 [Sinomonas cellulolyticus]|uniref:Phosphatase PAP2 family protein n=1 Tax=Sinomonas cellulolyticus TaxID=2801916 RepID=A0ABS1JY35_9MICC|nr:MULTISPECIES: phosphatase PAP2 family protein [Sinomonas]MBL0704108.1 phosphatase PAP2 family protein [Sinomonas cellulolyticus]GHG57106.1 hypothetical protein GCM10012320_30010 [Sinomonas sp. KCTC 49339]
MSARRRPSVGPFLLGALAAAGACAAVYWAFVRTPAGQGLDEQALLEAAALFGGWSRTRLAALNYLPAASAVVAAAVLAWTALARRRRSAASVAFAAVLVANAAAYALKHWVFLRPDFGYGVFGENTMPSGHATLTASAAAAVFLVAGPLRRPAVAFAGAGYASVTGLVMLVNQWHLAGDVVDAFFLVSAVMAPAYWLVLRLEPAAPAGPRTEDFRRRWLAHSVRVCLASAAVAAVSLALALVVPEGERRVGSVPQFLAAGAGAIAAAGYACSAAALWLGDARTRRGTAQPRVRRWKA